MKEIEITDNLILKSNLKGLNAIVDEGTNQELLIPNKDYKKLKEAVKCH